MAESLKSESTYLDSATGDIVWDSAPSTTIDKTPTTAPMPSDTGMIDRALCYDTPTVPREDHSNSSGSQEGRASQATPSASLANKTPGRHDDSMTADTNVMNYSSAENTGYREDVDAGTKANVETSTEMDFAGSEKSDVRRILEQCEALDETDRLQLTSALFTKSVVNRGQEFEDFVGCDFIRDTLEALEILSSCSVTNIVAHLVKSLKDEKLGTESQAYSLIESILVALEDTVTIQDFPNQFKELLEKHWNPSMFDFINLVFFPKGSPKFVYNDNSTNGKISVHHIQTETQMEMSQGQECSGTQTLDLSKGPFQCKYCGVTFRKASQGQAHEESLKCLKCTFCETLLDSRQSWREHLLSNHASKTCHICMTCGKGFNRRENLNRHMKTVHLNEKAFTCKTCFRTFTEKTNLEEHIRLHTGEKPFTCKICREIFRTRSLYSKHLKQVHGISVKDVSVDEVFKCTQCDRTFHREGDLGRHIKASHIGLRAYECATCQRTFAEKNELSEHERIHTGEKPYACDLCNDTFRTEGLYHRHVAFKHRNKSSKLEPVPTPNLQCKICDKQFIRKDNLQRHWTSVHVNERTFTCPTCKASFNQKSNLDDHIRLHTGETPYLCTKCPQSFRTQELYRKHVASSHGFICEICNLKFKSASSLAWHRKTHQDKDTLQTRFKCHGCPKSFPFRYQRERHFQQTHRGIKKSVCKVCGRRTNNLSEHMAVHDRRIRFTCATCGEGFIHRASYKRHVVRHLGLQLSCPLCEKRFATPDYLKTHLSRTHKDSKIEPEPENQITMPGTSLPDHIRVRKGGRKPNDDTGIVPMLVGDHAVNQTDHENPDNILLQHSETPEPTQAEMVQTITELASQSNTEAAFEDFAQSVGNESLGPWGDHPYQPGVQLLPTPMDTMDTKEMTTAPHIVMITKADGSQGDGSEHILQLVPTPINVHNSEMDMANIVHMIPKAEDLQHMDRDSV